MAGGRLTAIYVLRDCDGVVRYVGQSASPRAREQGHRKPSYLNRSPCAQWTRENSFTLEIVEWTDNADQREIEVIAGMRNDGAPLLNVTDGGKTVGIPAQHSNRYPAYKWAMAFCRRRGLSELSALLKAKAKKAKRENAMADFDWSLLTGIGEAAPAHHARLIATRYQCRS